MFLAQTVRSSQIQFRALLCVCVHCIVVPIADDLDTYLHKQIIIEVLFVIPQRPPADQVLPIQKHFKISDKSVTILQRESQCQTPSTVKCLSIAGRIERRQSQKVDGRLT